MKTATHSRRVVGRRGHVAEIVLDAEFQSMSLPLAPEELGQIHEKFLLEGCRDPLLVWRHRGQTILLVGYPIFPLIQMHCIPFRVIEKDFTYRDDARVCIIKELLALMTMSELAISYYRGFLYDDEKQPQGGDRRSPEAVQAYQGAMRTAEALAQMFHKSPRTIERDGALAKAVNRIAAEGGDEIKGKLLARGGPLKREAVLKMSRLEPAALRKVVNEWRVLGEFAHRLLPRAKSNTITVPREPKRLVDELVRRLNEEEVKATFAYFGEVMTRLGQK